MKIVHAKEEIKQNNKNQISSGVVGLVYMDVFVIHQLCDHNQLFFIAIEVIPALHAVIFQSNDSNEFENGKLGHSIICQCKLLPCLSKHHSSEL